MAEITKADEYEWVLPTGLGGLEGRMGLSKRQITEYRKWTWIEGIHFKKYSPNPNASGGKMTIWYNYTLINRLVGDA
ncbi:excisionase family protein [Klebsiella aerogenes]|uniref:excisionase family protein n=1 Tax=Klebsiella aerogenes TaxID=548 RepID=UPI0027ED767A|nr:excisionase family protein [Klebsiella aerogenes]